MSASEALMATVGVSQARTRPFSRRPEPAPGPVDADASLAVGAIVGRYVVVSTLGAGGMGVVYAAYDPELDRRVALKLLRAEIAGSRSQSEAQARLVREAHALAKLSHPNVVAIFDVGEHAGSVWLAMEYVDGVTLDAWLKATPRTTDAILEKMIAAGRGLAAAHEAGLLHRDFKPENVMVGRDGRARVMDLGLARASPEGPQIDDAAIEAPLPEDVQASLSGIELQVTRAGAILGTPAYMSPEHFRGRELDARSDIFAYCVTLYEALHGERPFAGASMVALAANVLAGAIRPPPRQGRRVPRWLRRVYTRGLAVEPGDRFPSMAALLSAIERGRARARRRRWIGAALGVAALVGGPIALDRHDMSKKTAACAAEGAVIDEVWNDAARARLRAGMEATGSRFAAQSLEILVPWLDEYRDAWSAGRSEACANATITEAWGDALLDRSAWCFEDRRLQLEATVQQISTLSPASARRAVRIASYLDPVATCLDPNLLERLPVPPLEVRGEVRAIRATISASDQRRYEGHSGDALDLAIKGRERAEALGWSPLLALARFAEGRSLHEDGRSRQAEEVLLRAYFEALSDGSTVVAFRAARSLIGVYTGLRRFHEAEVWSRHADALAASIADPSGLDAAEGHYLLAQVLAGQREYDAAAAEGELALAMRSAALGPDHPITTAALRNLGIVYLAQGRHGEALRSFVRAQASWEDEVGDEHPQVAEIAVLRGRALFAMGEVDEALALLRQGLAIHERVLGEEHPKTIQDLGELGQALLALGRVDEAEPMLQRVMEAERARRGARHPSFAESLLSMAAVDLARGRDVLAIDRSAAALEILEAALEPEHPDIAAALERVADIDQALGLSDAAIARRRDALARREAARDPRHRDLIAPLVALGDALLATRRQDEARQSYARALAIGEARLGPSDAALVPSLSALSQVALADGDADEAARLGERAVRLAEAEEVGPRWSAAAHFAAARALAARDGRSPEARALAEAAAREYATCRDEEGEAAVSRWLAGP
ncbi:MAG: serine/threonine protein kinase [Myxococcales bacterium]|nr:serine/threonine protein kinase [Myxococcales bacterium]